MQRRILIFSAALGVLLGLTASSARAIEPYSFSVALLGGLGGAPDADGNDDIDHRALQLNLAMVVQPETLLGLRIGEVELDDDAGVGGLADATLRYATISGEYRFDETFYESGLFVGLGAYDLSGDPLFEGVDDDTAIGGTLGVTGEFLLTRRLSVLVELAGHWADLDRVQIFANGHAGVAFRF